MVSPPSPLSWAALTSQTASVLLLPLLGRRAAEDAASSSQKSQGLLFPRGMFSFHVTGRKRSKSMYLLSLSATHPPVAKVLC